MEPKQACCSRERCFGIRIEKLCFVFAVINAVIVGLNVIGSLIYAGYILWTLLDPAERRAQGSNSLFWFISIICVVYCLATLIAATFAILLCIGLTKKNPRYVMAYLVYGITVEVLSVAGIIAVRWPAWKDSWEGHNSLHYVYSAVCVVYAFLLLLVYQTYLVLSDRRPPASHIRLIDNPRDC